MQDASREGGAKLWGNVETAEFECPSIEEYARWRPVPIERLKEKLDLAARYSERIVTQGYREYCRGPEGWQHNYRAVVLACLPSAA